MAAYALLPYSLAVGITYRLLHKLYFLTSPRLCVAIPLGRDYLFLLSHSLGTALSPFKAQLKYYAPALPRLILALSPDLHCIIYKVHYQTTLRLFVCFLIML